MERLPRVAISIGDPRGIGPEVTVAALDDARVRASLTALVFGDRALLDRAAATRDLHSWAKNAEVRAVARTADRSLAVPFARDGKSEQERDDQTCGSVALGCVDAALRAVAAGEADALCTAPLSKHRVSLALPHFRGHTEHLAAFTSTRVAMMMAGPRLRVVLASNHLALADVPRKLTRQGILEVIVLAHRGLQDWFGVAAPRIAVCGLNPHAGDGGLFGDEEARLVTPAVAEACAKGIDARGPLAADGLFPKAAQGSVDAVVALYHDQGLIPAKLLDFRETVNVTLGLPWPRTSPDHGTADEIAGKGIADPEPMISALLLAARLARGSS